MHEGLKDRDYLGDGVYVGHNGFQIVLWIECSCALGPDTIAMESHTLAALDRYRKRVGLE